MYDTGTDIYVYGHTKSLVGSSVDDSDRSKASTPVTPEPSDTFGFSVAITHPFGPGRFLTLFLEFDIFS